jgi:hypothetical protein
MEKPYTDGGPYGVEDDEITYEYHWTLGTMVNAMLEAGLVL